MSNLDTPAASWTTPADVNLDLKATVLEQYREWNVAADLPDTDELDDWYRHAIIQDAEYKFAFDGLLATNADWAEVATAVISKMVMWRDRGIDRRLIMRLFEPWIDMALSDSYRAAQRERWQNLRSDDS